MGIQSTGIGSNLDVNGLVSKLMQVESQPLTALATKEASYQAKVSAFGTLTGAVNAFQSSLNSLNNPTTFQNLSATSSDSSVITSSTSSVAAAGTYNVSVTKIAQSQSLSSAGQASTTSSIGSNSSSTTITFQFGTISGGTLLNGKYTGATFTQDPNQASTNITINSSNNSLQGIRDAINAASVGVTASIVGDGSALPYHLVLNSTKSGAASSLRISTSGETGGTDVGTLLNYDPEQATQTFTEVQTAQNAALTVNGVGISSSSNNVTTAIQGLTINALKSGSATLTVAPNTNAIQTGINSFVKAYNDLNSALNTLTSYNASTQKAGVLLGDATARGIQSQIRGALATAVNGLGGKVTTLSSVGISFQKDGSLALDSSKLSTALTTSFTEIGGLFSSVGKASDSLTSVVGSSSSTKPGNYPLNITSFATQGALTGDANLSSGLTIVANTTLAVTIDGISSNVNLSAGTYTSAQLTTLLQSSINGVSSFSSSGLSLVASIDSGTGFLTLKSNSYGSTSNVTLTSVTGTAASAFTGTLTTGTAGQNVAGTINGVGATGAGQILTASAGTDAEGLKVLINGGSIGDRGSLYFSRGYAYKLTNLVSNFTGTSGSITASTNSINQTIKDIGKQRTTLNSRLIDTEARYRAQFIALDKTISTLNNTSTFLTQQLSALTNSNNK